MSAPTRSRRKNNRRKAGNQMVSVGPGKAVPKRMIQNYAANRRPRIAGPALMPGAQWANNSPRAQRSRNRSVKKAKKEKNWWDTLAGFGGTLLGHAGAAGVKALVGLGDYEAVETNSVMAQLSNGSCGSTVPLMENSKVANIIRHREYLGDVFSSTAAFTTTTFNLNPGLDQTFPWLALIANQYESYRMRGLVYEFKSLASEVSGTPGLGYVALATQYNTQQPSFPDKKSMENHEFCNSARPSENFLHPIECKQNQVVLGQQYVRSGAVPTGADVRFYDMGLLTLAVGGQSAAGVVIGELWATYECEFYQAKSSTTQGLNIGYDMWTINSGSVSGATPFGSNLQKGQNSNLGTAFNTLNAFVFPNNTRGRFYLQYWVQGGSAALTIMGVPALVNANFVANFFEAGPLTVAGTTAGTTSTTYSQMFAIDIVGDGARVTFSVTAVLPVNPSGYLIITQIPSAVNLSDNFTRLGRTVDKLLQSQENQIALNSRNEVKFQTMTLLINKLIHSTGCTENEAYDILSKNEWNVHGAIRDLTFKKENNMVTDEKGCFVTQKLKDRVDPDKFTYKVNKLQKTHVLKVWMTCSRKFGAYVPCCILHDGVEIPFQDLTDDQVSDFHYFKQKALRFKEKYYEEYVFFGNPENVMSYIKCKIDGINVFYSDSSIDTISSSESSEDVEEYKEKEVIQTPVINGTSVKFEFCIFCKKKNPDHPGRFCTMNPKNILCLKEEPAIISTPTGIFREDPKL